MNIRKGPMLKPVRVPSLLEPSSIRTGTEFHPYRNRVPPVLERCSIRIATTWMCLMGHCGYSFKSYFKFPFNFHPARSIEVSPLQKKRCQDKCLHRFSSFGNALSPPGDNVCAILSKREFVRVRRCFAVGCPLPWDVLCSQCRRCH